MVYVDGVGDVPQCAGWTPFLCGVCEALGCVARRVSNVSNFCWIPAGLPEFLAAVWTRNCTGAKSREKLVYVDAS